MPYLLGFIITIKKNLFRYSDQFENYLFQPLTN